MKEKKAVMGPVISVFVMILVISIIAGLTFLFVAQLKSTALTTSELTTTRVANETGTLTSTPYTLAKATELGFANPTDLVVINSTGVVITSGNYTISSTGILTNATAQTWDSIKITYTYSHVKDEQSWNAVNKTEESGVSIVGYLPLIFLAVIFGAILTLVLKIILPYINLGNQIGGF